MEQALYEKVLAPAIRHAYEAGTRYRDIRDAVRPVWKPCEWKSSAIGLLVPLGGVARPLVSSPLLLPGSGLQHRLKERVRRLRA